MVRYHYLRFAFALCKTWEDFPATLHYCVTTCSIWHSMITFLIVRCVTGSLWESCMMPCCGVTASVCYMTYIVSDVALNSTHSLQFAIPSSSPVVTQYWNQKHTGGIHTVSFIKWKTITWLFTWSFYRKWWDNTNFVHINHVENAQMWSPKLFYSHMWRIILKVISPGTMIPSHFPTLSAFHVYSGKSVFELYRPVAKHQT